MNFLAVGELAFVLFALAATGILMTPTLGVWIWLAIALSVWFALQCPTVAA